MSDTENNQDGNFDMMVEGGIYLTRGDRETRPVKHIGKGLFCGEIIGESGTEFCEWHDTGDPSAPDRPENELVQFLGYDHDSDVVNHPPHYQGKIECIEFLEDHFSDRPHEWNAVKYLTRANRKGKEVEDLEKAIWYIRRKLALLSGAAPRPNDMKKESV